LISMEIIGHLHQLFADVRKPSCNPVLRFCGLVLCDLSTRLIKAQLVAIERPPSGGLFVWRWQVSCERLATHPVLDRRCASAEQGHDLQVLF
jgi:hypothetical protein